MDKRPVEPEARVARKAGLKTYISTFPCRRCGGLERYVRAAACVECARKRSTLFRTNHPDYYAQWAGIIPKS